MSCKGLLSFQVVDKLEGKTIFCSVGEKETEKKKLSYNKGGGVKR